MHMRVAVRIGVDVGLGFLVGVSIASESSNTRFFGYATPLLRVSLFPGTTNRTFAPRLLNWFLAKFWAPRPTPTKVITDAFPITIPNIVRRLLSLFDLRVDIAIDIVSVIAIFLDITNFDQIS